MKKILDEFYYQKHWEDNKVYSYNSQVEKENTFVIDTPPPTISGALHIGHVFSYTQTDILARFQRMIGKNIFYPMGWDNNGLPTERRVQNLYKITCDPTLSSERESWEELLLRKEKKKLSHFIPISRKTFIHICSQQTKEDQKKYEKLWRHLALSVDWSQTYETISPQAQIISQKSFLDLYVKNLVENRYTPVFWDTQFKTAVAQADIEDRQKKGFYHDIKFHVQGGEGEFVISTTRPELLPACVAVAAHPEDERYKNFFHKEALTPLFSSTVPILPSLHADPKKGTGILMICTFGDTEDVRFWEKHSLPLKQIINSEGFLKKIKFKLLNDTRRKSVGSCPKESTNKAFNMSENSLFFSLNPDQANKYYSELGGLRVEQARKKIVKILSEKKYLVSDPKLTEQFVKFYEKGDYPLELIPTRQWYIKILEYKDKLLEQGRRIKWHPPSMLKRYEQWVEGLNQDWCISRQRFFGVPFPVWYPLDENKLSNYNKPLLPDTKLSLNKIPIDPMFSAPADWNSDLKSYTEKQRGKARGFTADTAVMDTWATSSLTPQINSYWNNDEQRHKKLFPADLRPQAHEIIRTWAFYTIVKSFFHESSVGNNSNQKIPWKNVAISGWVVDPQRLKISKSKTGSSKKNFSPEKLIEEYSADAIRYWAGKARLGMDTVYDESMFKTGKKLVVKLHSAFRFTQIQVHGMHSFFAKHFDNIQNNENKFNKTNFIGLKKSLSYVSTDIDRSWLMYLLEIQNQACSLLKQFNYASALDLIEKSFWRFCDNYLELVKGRAYQFSHFDIKENVLYQNAQSAVYSLDISMYLFIKMLAPYMPYVTEHIWLQRYSGENQKEKECGEQKKSSVHLSIWNERFSHNLWLNNKKEDDFIKYSNNLLNFSFYLLEQIRTQKASQQKSLSTPLKELKVITNKKNKSLFELCREDIAKAAHVNSKNIFIQEVEKDILKVSINLKN